MVKGQLTMYLDEKNPDLRLLAETDCGSPTTDPIENLAPWGLDDPEVFASMKGIREAISEWLLEWRN
jgi:hypothetical protein